MVSVVISYCNNDIQFMEENIKQALKFSSDIVIPYYLFSLDGNPEDRETLNSMFALASMHNVKMVNVEYEPEKSPVYHHNKMRWYGLQECAKDRSHVLFLDADEIMEGQLMHNFLSTKQHINYDVISFECYWYFREKYYRAVQTEQAAVMCNKRICSENYIYSNAERWEFLNLLSCLTAMQHVTYDGKIMCHHYSWVRSYDQMMRKVVSWGHRSDKNWIQLVKEEFSRPFEMKDFVHNYQYQIIHNETSL